MEDLERIKEHLRNIQSVEPIISALRTIAASAWRQARSRLQATQDYTEDLGAVLASLLPRLTQSSRPLPFIVPDRTSATKTALVVIASDRGLCGSYNDIILERADRHLAQRPSGTSPLLITLGSRAEQHFLARGTPLFLAQPMPVTRVVSYRAIGALAGALEKLLISGMVEAIDLVYAPYRGGMAARAEVTRWLPITPSQLPEAGESDQSPIIEGDAVAIARYALEEWTRVRLFHLIVESVATEHASRYFAMERASDNLSELIEELTQVYHSARQHAITMEMLDLVAGSGILKPPSERQIH
ncbi:MAG: F0F1 ATP synthase subunit gamma [Anaerolineae bacterium]